MLLQSMLLWLLIRPLDNISISCVTLIYIMFEFFLSFPIHIDSHISIMPNANRDVPEIYKMIACRIYLFVLIIWY